MKFLYSFCILAIFTSLTAKAEVLSYKSWKSQQVKEAQTSVKKAKATPGHDEELYKALLSLEMSKDLTVNDYFVIYLSKHKDGKKALQQAAKKLSRDDVATLLSFYKDNLGEKNQPPSEGKSEIPNSAPPVPANAASIK